MHLTLAVSTHGWHPAARPMSATVDAARLAPYAAIAGTAERAGFDALLLGVPEVADRQRAEPAAMRLRLDPLPLLGALIATTSRIGLAAWWPVDTAEPFHVARVLATLDHLSGGRTGWIAGRMEPAALARDFGHAPPPDPDAAWARGAELVDVARQLWDSWEDAAFVADQASGDFADPARVHPILHEGRFFNVRGPLNVPRPVQGQPVILHCDPGDAEARELAAASAELVLADGASIDAARILRAEWRTLAAHVGRDPDGVRLLLSVMPILADSTDAAAARAAQLDTLAATPSSAAIPARRFVGTPAGFAVHLAAWHDAGACDGFTVLPAVTAPDLDLLVGGVLPLLRARGLRAESQATTLRDRLGLHRPASRFAA